MEDIIDDEWIFEFNEDERNYATFYAEPNTFVSLQMIYVNSKKEIEHSTQLKQQLDKENVLLSTTLNKIVLERNHIGNAKFKLYKLLLHNVSVEPEEIIANTSYTPPELREITEIKDVILQDTINHFKSLNTLFFIFVSKDI
jgi:deoxyadenosine/deoxycytidine kinase